MIATPHVSLPRPHFLGRWFAAPRHSSPPCHIPLLSPSFSAATCTTSNGERASTLPVPPPPISLYGVLGLAEKATIQEIKAAYRNMARACHPDACSGASADEFMRVHAAYSTLSDPAKREQYDRQLIALRRSPQGYRFSGEARRRTWETDQCW